MVGRIAHVSWYNVFLIYNLSLFYKKQTLRDNLSVACRHSTRSDLRYKRLFCKHWESVMAYSVPPTVCRMQLAIASTTRLFSVDSPSFSHHHLLCFRSWPSSIQFSYLVEQRLLHRFLYNTFTSIAAPKSIQKHENSVILASSPDFTPTLISSGFSTRRAAKWTAVLSR